VNVRYLADDAGVLLHPLPRDLEPGVAAGGGVPDASEVVHAVLQPEIPVGAQARRTRIETQKKKKKPPCDQKKKKKVPRPAYFSKSACIFLSAAAQGWRASSRKEAASRSSFLRSQ
jgi:hypothetical protein